MAKKPRAIPKSLGGCADRLFKLRDEKALLASQVKVLSEEEGRIKEHLINTLPKSKAEGITGKAARARILQKDVPSVDNWEQLYKYVKRTGSFELLARKVNAVAVKERWEDKKKVPGVKSYKVTSVSITKK